MLAINAEVRVNFTISSLWKADRLQRCDKRIHHGLDLDRVSPIECSFRRDSFSRFNVGATAKQATTAGPTCRCPDGQKSTDIKLRWLLLAIKALP